MALALIHPTIRHIVMAIGAFHNTAGDGFAGRVGTALPVNMIHNCGMMPWETMQE